MRTQVISPARTALVAALALHIGACEGFLDVNKNPNAPERRHVKLF